VTENTKYVTIRHEVPRDPEAYRATIHFGQRLRERVPDEKRDAVVRECIEHGECSGSSPPRNDEHDTVRQYFAFDRSYAGRRWRMIVAIRPQAYLDADEKHLAVTIIEVDDD